MNHLSNLFADQSPTNKSGNNYADALQAATERMRLFKLSFSPLAGAVDAYVWVFDVAAGDNSSAAPVAVRFVPAGYSDTWDFGYGGSLFQNGIYVRVSTVPPTTATTTVTAAGNNILIIKADIG